MTINEVYKFLNFLSNKTQSGVIRITDFNLAADRAQKELFQVEYKLFQSTQEITDAMKNFLVPKVVYVDATGKALYPIDYFHTTAVRKYYYHNNTSIEVDVTEVNDDEIGKYRSSSIVQPTSRYPIIYYYNDYMQVLPKNTASINLDYLKKPSTPLWDYDLINGKAVFVPRGGAITTNTDVNGVVTAVPRTSQSNDFEFPDFVHNQLVFMMCSFLSINIRETELTQYSEMMKGEEKD